MYNEDRFHSRLPLLSYLLGLFLPRTAAWTSSYVFCSTSIPPPKWNIYNTRPTTYIHTPLPPPMPAPPLVTTVLLPGILVSRVLIGIAWLLLGLRRPRTVRVRGEIADRRTSCVGCPVLFTDRTRFEGGRRCFELGEQWDLPPPSVHPVMSVAVRTGYHVIGYSAPGFEGEKTLELRGPAERSYVDLEAEPMSGESLLHRQLREGAAGREEHRRSSAPPVVRSMRIHLDTRVRSASARRRRVELEGGSSSCAS